MIHLQCVLPSRETAIRHVRWLNDRDVTRYSELRHTHHTIETELAYLASVRAPDLLFAIMIEDQPVGVINAVLDIRNLTADLGIMIGDKGAWGHGIGSEAWGAMIDMLTEYGVRKIEAGCMEANAAMIKICKNSGMVEEGRRFGHFLLDEQPQDMIFFGRFNERTAAQQPIRSARPVLN